MPELPEVETIARDLSKSLKNSRIISVDFITGSIWKNRIPQKRLLLGNFFEIVKRKGKNLIFKLSNQSAIVAHLKMTGKFLFSLTKIDYPKHTHFVLGLSNGILLFNDVRRFGYLDYVPAGLLDKIDYLNKLGPDPFEINTNQFREIIKSKSRMIKPLLMDQQVISGLGNIYTDETLFATRINPKRVSSRISKKKIDQLYSNTIDILKKAIKARGSSVSDYVDGSGKQGNFQLNHKVYGLEDQPCPRCGARIKRENIGGRSSHFCPRCQRL